MKRAEIPFKVVSVPNRFDLPIKGANWSVAAANGDASRLFQFEIPKKNGSTHLYVEPGSPFLNFGEIPYGTEYSWAVSIHKGKKGDHRATYSGTRILPRDYKKKWQDVILTLEPEGRDLKIHVALTATGPLASHYRWGLNEEAIVGPKPRGYSKKEWNQLKEDYHVSPSEKKEYVEGILHDFMPGKVKGDTLVATGLQLDPGSEPLHLAFDATWENYFQDPEDREEEQFTLPIFPGEDLELGLSAKTRTLPLWLGDGHPEELTVLWKLPKEWEVISLPSYVECTGPSRAHAKILSNLSEEGNVQSTLERLIPAIVRAKYYGPIRTFAAKYDQGVTTSFVVKAPLPE